MTTRNAFSGDGEALIDPAGNTFSKERFQRSIRFAGDHVKANRRRVDDVHSLS
jgi:hypothetical protein